MIFCLDCFPSNSHLILSPMPSRPFPRASTYTVDRQDCGGGWTSCRLYHFRYIDLGLYPLLGATPNGCIAACSCDTCSLRHVLFVEAWG